MIGGYCAAARDESQHRKERRFISLVAAVEDRSVASRVWVASLFLRATQSVALGRASSE